MNQTDQLALSLFAGSVKEAFGEGALGSIFRGIGRGGATATKGLNLAGDVMHDLPGQIFRGGGRFAKGIAKLPGQAMEEMRAGYAGAPIRGGAPKVNPFAGNVSNEALEGMGMGPKTSWPEAVPTGATAGERATAAMPPDPTAFNSTAGPGPGGGNGIPGAGEGPGVGAAQQYWRPKTPMQNVGSIINRMPAERIRRAMGLATGGGRNLADVGQRGALLGGAGLYGGTIAAQAPGKMENNARYDWQQQHPIISRIGQSLGLMAPAEYRNYFNPFK